MEPLTEWLASGPRVVQFRSDELDLPTASLLRAMGYAGPGACAPTAQVEACLGRLRQRAERWIDARAVWTVTPATVTGGDICCTRPIGHRLAIGDFVGRFLKHSRAVVAFVATIGSALELEARQAMATGEPLDGFILDAIGSAAADACAGAAAQHIAKEAAACGWRATNRYSPGYCSWDTADQPNLFALLPEQPAGVELNASGLMRPLKSVSGVLGVGPDVRFVEYTCAFCAMKDCRQRLAAQLG